MRIKIKKITLDDAPKLALLAREIWEEHYGTIFGAKQTDNLIEELQNSEKIIHEMNNGFVYYFVKFQNRTVGYFNFLEKDTELYCGKLYLLQNFRGLGLGKEVFKAIEKEAILLGKKEMRLSVNSSNERSVSFYNAQGMKIEKTETNVLLGDITSVDFVMSKEVCPIEKSLKYFNLGYNCCQAIMMGFAPFMDIKSKHIITMGTAFGGGFARTGYICGALSGLGMVVSHIQGDTTPDSKNSIQPAMTKLVDEFTAQNISPLCSEIMPKLKEIVVHNGKPLHTPGFYEKKPCTRIIENTAIILLSHLQDLKKQNLI